MASSFVKRYLTALNRHKWAGLAGFSVVLGLSGVAALQPGPPATYVSNSLLTYVTPPITLTETGANLQAQGQALTAEALLSNDVIGVVVERLEAEGLQIDPLDIRANASVKVNPDDLVDDDAEGFYVQVSYQDADAERAQLVNTVLLDAIVERSRQFNAQQLTRILDNLNQLLPRVEADLREAEQAVERFVRIEGPNLVAAIDGSIQGEIVGSENQQRQLRMQVEAIDAQMVSLQQRLGLSPDQAYASSALSADPIIADLRARIYQNESQMLLLSQRLRPEHPEIQTLQAQQRTYDQLLNQRVNEVIGGGQLAAPIQAPAQIRQASSLDPARQALADQLVGLQTQRDTLVQQIQSFQNNEQELRQQYANLPNKQLDLARLQQQVDLKRAYYDRLQTLKIDAATAQNEVVGSLVLVQEPRTSLAEDVTRNPVMILVVGGLVGLLVGGGLVLLLDSLDATFHTLPDLQNALKQQEVPLLGMLPVLEPNQESDALIPVILEADSPFLEPYDRLRSNLRRFGLSGKALKVILLTSTVDGEGKTVTAYNFAITSARAGKRTLLIEADLRSPSKAESLRVAPDPTSAAEPLRYYAQLSECIRLVPEVENLYLLPSPGMQRQASAILESNEIRRLIDDVRGRFDMVIVDTPSLSRYSDALLIEPMTDGLILVTRPGHTEDGLLSEAIEQFTESDDIQFLGAVINGADIPIEDRLLPSDDERLYVEEYDRQAEEGRVRV